MGSPKDEWGRGAYTENQVRVTLTRSILVQQKETTQAEWTSLGLVNPSSPPLQPGFSGDCLAPSCPVGNMTWFEAAAFANLLSESQAYTPCYKLEGCSGKIGSGMTCDVVGTTAPTYYECEGYRLPGEAEWEYAARAGTATAFYTGAIADSGPDPLACASDPNLTKAAWYCANSSNVTHPGGQKLKNPWGLFDMLGNAHEWTNDVEKGLGYGDDPLTDPWGSINIGDKLEPMALRGGGPIAPASGCRAAGHFSVTRDGRGGGFGFRLVRSLIPKQDAGTADAGADAQLSDAAVDVEQVDAGAD